MLALILIFIVHYQSITSYTRTRVVTRYVVSGTKGVGLGIRRVGSGMTALTLGPGSLVGNRAKTIGERSEPSVAYFFRPTSH